MNDASPYSNLALGHRPEDKPKAIEYPPNHPQYQRAIDNA